MRLLTKETISKEGQGVELAGWVAGRRDHGKIIFIDLRDRAGLLQLVFTPGNKEVYTKAAFLRSEWIIGVRGMVKKRPAGMENQNIPTGNIEMEVNEMEILSEAKTPPFETGEDGYGISEDTRMRYRYLDLKRERLTKNLKNRAKVIKFIRDFLTERDFVEVETPILTKSTPEGARDYLVPSRLYKGKFYALPQSPQQYKQLLMVAGLERYFQIARCFRDEDTRGDRQPEFTQLDLEMSFVEREDVLSLVEELFTELIQKLFPEYHVTETPWPRLAYSDVMKQYGTDKPDLRKDKNDPRELAFAFVIDFPMFEWNEKEKKWDSTHHPFTMMKKEDLEYLDTGKLEKISADSYDFVLNGYELASGSIRINDPAIQKKVFSALGLTESEMQEKFGHMIEAFSFGAPPHGGMAPGIDRFLMIVQNEPNIREVIAFPKTGDARDLMTSSPSPVDKTQLDELGLTVKSLKPKVPSSKRKPKT